MASMVHEPVNFVVDESMHHRQRCIKLSNCNAPSVQQISWSQMGGRISAALSAQNKFLQHPGLALLAVQFEGTLET